MPAASSSASKSAARPRQDPVSCQLCRTKKLKCNREHPCSNCLARGVTCTLGNAVLPAVAAVIPRSVSVAVDSNAIVARLDRIESLLLNQRSPQLSNEPKRSPTTISSPKSTETAYGLQSLHPTVQSEHEETLKHDSQRLYGIATRDKSELFTEGYGITLRISPLNKLIERAKAPIDGFVGYSSSWEPRRLFWLPPKSQAIKLLTEFREVVDFSHHVLYMKDALTVLEDVYRNPMGDEPVDPSHLGLLFGAFAGVAGHRSCHDINDGLFSSRQEAMSICKLWLRHGLDCVSISRRVGAGTLHDVMMCIVLTFLVFNLEGFSVRARSLHASALTISRDLGLHKIDSPMGREENAKDNHITVEIKRRLWWHVASTDWLLGVSGGPQEGTYFVQPRHMAVNRPRNITDEELETQGPWLDHPLDVPTEMTYSLLRIRMAELARMISDAWPMQSSDIDNIDYSEIVRVDAKFEDLMSDMPVFFRLDDESRRRSHPVTEKFPYFIIQKYLIGIAIYMRRCKLHQPFLVRGSQDERFRYSREACIRAARAVVHAKQQLDEENEAIVARQLPLNLFVLHHLFVATIVLVMDLCFNRNENQEPDEARRAEVIYACKALESTKTTSALASKFLASLTEVLRKHQVNLLPGQDSNANSRSGSGSQADVTDSTDVDHQNHQLKMLHEAQLISQQQQQQQQQQIHQQPPSFQLDDIWQDWVAQGAQFQPTNASSWDSLFAELEHGTSVGWDMNMNLDDFSGGQQ